MFCPVCGCGFVGAAHGIVAVNLRSTEGVDLKALNLKFNDGKTH